jgi:hypothetical protein
LSFSSMSRLDSIASIFGDVSCGSHGGIGLVLTRPLP